VFAITTFTSSFTYAGLIPDRSALRGKISEQYINLWNGTLVLSESDYTISSWSQYISSLDNAKQVHNNLLSSQSQINQALSILNNSITGLVFAGKAYLDIAKSNVALKNYADYTSNSWQVLTNTLLLPERTNSEVVAKTTAINNAISGLVFAGQASLDTSKLNANSKLQADYTVESWKVLADALLLPETTNNEVVIKTSAINNAITGLVFAGTPNLNIAKTNAGLKKEVDYTSGSWKVLTDALLLPETTNSEVVAKTTAINNAISGLVFANQADLDATKLNVNSKFQAEYTTVSWKVLADALLLPETTNDEVVSKIAAINNAITGLIFAGTPNLNIAKTNASLKKEIDYTSGSWQVLVNSLLLPETTNSEVVAKTLAINNAISGLVFAGQSNLNASILNANSKLQEYYTVESWKVLADALLLLETTNDEVVAKTMAINNAITGLIFAGTPNLNIAKTNAGLKKSIDYTSGSWQVLANALLLPETTNNEIVIKTAIINNAINSLVFAGKANLDLAKSNASTKVKSVYTVESWKVLTDALALPETTNNLVLIKTASINKAIDSLTFASVKYKVTAYIGLNCRVFPNIYSPKVKAYPYGTILDITEIINGWGKTKYGWICMNYAIKAVTTSLPNYIVTPYVGLNCRVSANIDSKKVKAYSYKAILEISEILNGWGKTQRGWVCMQYLRGI
jgi:hypothetical protein